jgi:hypothetical protein
MCQRPYRYFNLYYRLITYLISLTYFFLLKKKIPNQNIV